MTPQTGESRPGDGPRAPAGILRFRLDTADALAWESQPRRLTGWRAAAFVMWLACGALWLHLLPAGLVPHSGMGFVLAVLLAAGVHYLIAIAFLTWRTFRRAVRRLPGPVDMVVEDEGNRLLAYPAAAAVDGKAPRGATVIAPADLSRVVRTPERVFLSTPTDLLIMPRAAFADAAAMAAFAAAWDPAARA